MTKKVKIAVIACALAYVLAFAAVICILILNKDDSIDHLDKEQSLQLSLFRDGYSILNIGDKGMLEPTTDDTRTDFTSASDKNVFGLESNTVIVPGSSFTVNMSISNDLENSVPFAYWLSIELSGESNALAEQLEVTVTVGGKVSRFPLSEGYTIGGESAPLAKVGLNETSAFSVKLEYDKYNSDNTSQGKTVYFDLIVHAVQTL